MVKAHFVPRKDGPASARKKNKPGWYKNGVPTGMGIKKPLETDSSDSDSSDSEDEDVKPMFTNLMRRVQKKIAAKQAKHTVELERTRLLLLSSTKIRGVKKDLCKLENRVRVRVRSAQN